MCPTHVQQTSGVHTSQSSCAVVLFILFGLAIVRSSTPRLHEHTQLCDIAQTAACALLTRVRFSKVGRPCELSAPRATNPAAAGEGSTSSSSLRSRLWTVAQRASVQPRSAVARATCTSWHAPSFSSGRTRMCAPTEPKPKCGAGIGAYSCALRLSAPPPTDTLLRAVRRSCAAGCRRLTRPTRAVHSRTPLRVPTPQRPPPCEHTPRACSLATCS